MGLATGVEVKTEPTKSEDVVISVPLEELKTVVTPVETTSALSVTTSVETPDATEVTFCLLSFTLSLSLHFFLSFLNLN